MKMPLVTLLTAVAILTSGPAGAGLFLEPEVGVRSFVGDAGDVLDRGVVPATLRLWRSVRGGAGPA